MSLKKEIIERLWFEYVKAYINDERSGESRLPMVDDTNRRLFLENLDMKIKVEMKNQKIKTFFISKRRIKDEIHKRRFILGI